MCEACGCAAHLEHQVNAEPGREAVRHVRDGRATLEVMEHLLEGNNRAAEHNRAHFATNGVLAVNLMSAPGSGKTSLLEATIEALSDRYRIGVIVGDLATENDAQRLRAKHVQAVQITTGQACHLDAEMVHDGLHALDVAALDIVFIENVGNLVCPASFDLGEHLDVVLLSVPEGDDKPAKYPVMFRKADLVVITKSDLLAVMDDFDPRRVEAHVRALASETPVIGLSSRQPATLAHWLAWIEDALRRQRGADRIVPAQGSQIGERLG